MVSFHILRRLRSARVGVLAATPCCLLLLLAVIALARDPVSEAPGRPDKPPEPPSWLDETPKPPWWVEVKRLPGADLNRGRHPAAISAMVIDPHGKWIATCGGDAQPILFWDSATLKEVGRIETKGFGVAPRVEALAVSNDGKIFAALVSDSKCHIWHAADQGWKHVSAIDSGEHYHHDVVFLRDRNVLAISTFVPSVDMWDVTVQPPKRLGQAVTAENQLSPKWDTGRAIASMAFSSGGDYLYTLLGEWSCLVWDLRKQPWQIVQTVKLLDEHTVLALSPDGKVALFGPTFGGGDGFYRTENGRLERQEPQPAVELGRIVRFAPDGSMFATDSDGFEIHIRTQGNTKTQQWAIDYSGVVRQPRTFGFVPGRTAIAVAMIEDSNDIDVWDLSGERPVSLRATLAQKEKEKAEPKK